MAGLDKSIDPAVRGWVVESAKLLERVFPDVAEYLEATARAVGVDYLAMQASYFSYVGLSARAEEVEGVDDPEGCSTAAGVLADGGAWLVKNRDTPGWMMDSQSVIEHRDPSWGGAAVVGVSSVGGSMAGSSGINSHGLASVSTSIVGRLGEPGIARAHLQDALLARCETVDEALEIIRSIQHVGGTMTLVDATGTVAAVELSPSGAVIERKQATGGVARTNHYVQSENSTFAIIDPVRLENSSSRLESMECVVDETELDAPWPEVLGSLRSRMATHDGPGAQCRHGAAVVTVSTTIYRSRPPTMFTSDGPGCSSPWVAWSVGESA